ncbi:MAG: hypothetical protein Q7T74_01625, partial [Candidatus Saccharibacteria bacterium]|nr:hypothetical protein [Candidatus Saccharibacteria bacterium]
CRVTSKPATAQAIVSESGFTKCLLANVSIENTDSFSANGTNIKFATHPIKGIPRRISTNLKWSNYSTLVWDH